MRKFPFLLILVLSFSAFSQNDSVTLVSGRWTVDTVDTGLVLKTVRFSHKELFSANQCISLLELSPESPYRLAFSHEQRRTPTSQQAKRHGAVAAVNGSFFDMERHNPICYLRIHGKELGQNTPGTDTVNRKYYQYGTMVLRFGRPLIMRTDSSRHWERRLRERNIMTAGPLLIKGGERQPMRTDRTFVTQRHNRTAVGVRSDGTVVLFVVDGRMRESAGMSLEELIQTLSWLGCVDALNLDGGGSTTLWVRDRGEGGIVNYPTDNGRFDRRGERAVSNCVLVVKETGGSK